MKALFALGLSAACMLGIPGPADCEPFVVGVVIDGPWERNDEILSAFRSEILDLTQGEFDVQFPPDKTITSDWSVAGVRQAVDRLLADPEVDLLVASGVLTLQDVCRRGPLPKPVLAPFIVNPEVQGVPITNGTSGVPNLADIAFPADARRDFEVFLDIVPFQRAAILHSGAILEALPELRENVIASLGDLDLQVDFVSVGRSADAGLDALPDGTEAVLLVPLLGLPTEEFEKLVDGLIQRKLPSFSTVGSADVKRGILAGTAPDFNIPPLARRLALFVQRVLLGEQPSEFRVVFERGEQLMINDATTRKIGVLSRRRRPGCVRSC